MDATYTEHIFFPRKPEYLKLLPLDKIDCTVNKYITEKYFVINSNYIYRLEEFHFLMMNNLDTAQNISDEYLLKINKSYQIGKDYFTFQRRKLNFFIILNKTEQQIKQLYELLFYFFNSAIENDRPLNEDNISISILLCSFTYITDIKLSSILYDFPYTFFCEYVNDNKEEFELFSKSVIPKLKFYNLNLNKIESSTILYDLNVKACFIPQFFIYDKNYRIFYSGNLFQELSEHFVYICKELHNYLYEPFNHRKTLNLRSHKNLVVSTLIDKIEKEITKGNVLSNEEEFNLIKQTLTDKFINPSSNQKKASGTIYFIKKIVDLNKDFTEGPQSKVIYLNPIILQNSMLPDFLYGSPYVHFRRFIHKTQNEFLNYTYECARSYIANTGMKADITFVIKKRISNIKIHERREFIVEYSESFDNYCIPFNFKILFRDKRRFFSVTLFPKTNLNNSYMLNLKDEDNNDKILHIKENEITIIQYFREDLHFCVKDIGSTINTYKVKYPNVKINYYILVLIICDKFNDSCFKDEILKLKESVSHLNDLFIFKYDPTTYKEVTKYFPNTPMIYIFDKQRQMFLIEMSCCELGRHDDLVTLRLFRAINPLKWKFVVNKHQYKQVKDLRNFILGLNKYNNEKEIVIIYMKKTKYLESNKDNEYLVSVVQVNEELKMGEYLDMIKEKFIDIIGEEAKKIQFVK
jgi:hypothetical protein